MMSTGLPSFVVRHVFFRQDARDDALVAVAAGELVADRDVAQLRDFDVDSLDDAALELVARSRARIP